MASYAMPKQGHAAEGPDPQIPIHRHFGSIRREQLWRSSFHFTLNAETENSGDRNLARKHSRKNGSTGWGWPWVVCTTKNIGVEKGTTGARRQRKGALCNTASQAAVRH